MSFPKHITFLSDDTEVEFVLEVVGATKNGKVEKVAIYQYTRAKENLGRQFPMFLKDIERLKSCGYCHTDAPNLADKSILRVTHTTV